MLREGENGGIMKKYVIIPDVTCDLSLELREHFGLEEYIPSYVHIDDRQMQTTLDWSLIGRSEFYKLLLNKRVTVSSAAASPDEYFAVFEKYAKLGYDILSMSISSKISGTYNIACSAAKRTVEAYPECRVECIDTLRMSGSFGLLIAYALELQKEGRDLDTVVAWVNENRHRVHQMGPIDDMTFIARRGKVSAGKAFMGNLVGVKPMGDSNRDGYVSVLGKVKGISKALDATVGYIERVAENISSQYIFVMHSDRERYALELKDRIEAKFETKGVFVSDVFDACGTNIGPGMIAVYFLGAPISDDCAVEKDALTAVISELSNR